MTHEIILAVGWFGFGAASCLAALFARGVAATRRTASDRNQEDRVTRLVRQTLNELGRNQ